ncbi:hypothetical protein [Pseudomonas sp. Irchel s3h17]|uniref:hypothetical protein n=1 Tax=Pseudomonas sp. Irchel s3h17 TaxID=2009182 RepID=UPI00117A69EB|nr:hypothetical protein [Pseudomonas sp. Irchel s3h17]
MRELSIKDLEIVSGAVGPPGAIIGGVTAAAGYIGNAMATGEGNVSGLIGNTAAGAVAGFVLGPAGLGAGQIAASTAAGAQIGYYSGMLGGQIQSAIDAAGTNYGAAGTNYN